MALVRHNAAALRSRADAHELDDLLVRQARISFGSGVGAGEVRSWRESLPALLADVHDAGLDHVEVLLEHKLPFSPKRVDAILCGVDPRTRRPSYVVVELKQWTNAVSREDGLVEVPQYGRPVLHPVDQVRGYCEYLVDFVPSLAPEHSDVHGIAYLHNAAAAGWRLDTFRVDAHGRLFRGDQRGALVDELRRLLDADPDTAAAARTAADDLLGAAPRPSRPLLSVAADEVREREQFVLVDEQRVAYRMVEHAVDRARRHNTKTAVIVLGGPGSGKSVLALSLLGELARQGRSVLHATGSSAFTRTLRKVAGFRSTRTQKLFTYFNAFIGHEPNELDVVICDEAHRIREYSVNQYTPAAVRSKAMPQVDELIGIARVPVFLLDEHQVVRPGEMGTEAEIRAAAERAGCRVEVVRLAGQYRCGGSEFYEEWVRRLLGLDPHPPISWSELADSRDEHYRVAALPTPTALEAWLLGRVGESADTARLSAGYCWRWSDPANDDGGGKRLVDDVVVGEWSRPWNAKPGTRVPDAPESHYWASDPRGFGQVGCIYTAQGFEYDWSGVIMGPDLVRRGSQWVADRRASFDGPVKKAGAEEFPTLVRHTYKVLLTRGMRGTGVCSTDPETQEFLERMCR